MRKFYSYFDGIFFDRKLLLEKSIELLNKVSHEFDGFVATGVSGIVFTSILAHEMNKDFAVVRKTRNHSHSDNEIEGLLQNRYLFVDDFVSTGDTYNRVKRIVSQNTPSGEYICVGAFLYKDLPSFKFDGISNFYKQKWPYRGYFSNVEVEEMILESKKKN